MNVTLEQWKALISVVDSGGYENAAEALNKSQSSVTYAVQKLQSQLGVKAFEVKGRKAVLTPTGEFLYRRARALVDDAAATESAARKLSASALGLGFSTPRPPCFRFFSLVPTRSLL